MRLISLLVVPSFLTAAAFAISPLEKLDVALGHADLVVTETLCKLTPIERENFGALGEIWPAAVQPTAPAEKPDEKRR
jgi:hypothetical protein